MKQGWEIKKLGEVCETSSGGTPSKTHKEYYEGGNIPWLRSGEVSQGLIYDTELYITAEGLNNSSAKIFPIDTVVIAMYGATVGKVGILKNAMSTNQAVCGIFPTPKFAPLFLVYYLKAKKPYFLSLAAGGAQPNISQQIIRDTYISIPPREEQERIVAELDCLSGVIEKKREQLRELDALAQSIFYQMFGDPITNEKGWDVKKLSDAVSIDCPISYGIVQPMDDVEGGIPIVRPIDLVDTFVRKDNLKRTSVDISNAYKRTILRGDEILMCVRGTTGVVSMASDELKGCNTTRGIVPLFFDSINRWFVYYLIKQPSMQCLIAENTYGIALKQINIKELRLLPIITPPLSLQQEFADKIEAIEKQKELIKKSISETETLFNARMDYYFN